MRLMWLMSLTTVLYACTTMKDSNRPDEPAAAKQTYSHTHGVNFGVPPGWEGRMDEWEKLGRPPFAPEDVPANYGK